MASRITPIYRTFLQGFGCLMLAACGQTPVAATLVDDADWPVLAELRSEGPIRSHVVSPGSCVFAGSTATLTLTSGDKAVVSRRLSDGAILVNDVPCGSATSVNTKVMSIVESGPAGPQTVVLDYLNGLFALGTNTPGTGIVLNYGTDANDKLMLRMTSGADNVRFGQGGINLNSDRFKDIAFTSMPTAFVVSLASGSDIFSGAGDTVTGAAFAVPLTIYGGDGKDTLRGGNGNDLLFGDADDDILDGEASATGGADIFDGGNGNDTVTYAARTSSVRVTIGDGTDDGEVGERDTILDTVETVIGGSGDDTLSGSLNPNLTKTLNGGPGNDNFLQRNTAGPDSHDTLIGGLGIDTVDYSMRTQGVVATMDGAAANDGVAGENDNIKADVENIRTGSGDDTLTGNALANTFYASSGNNILYGGAGDDIFDQGTDAASLGHDTIDGGLGVDLVDYSKRTRNLTISLDGVTTSGDLSAGEVDLIMTSVENALGGSGSDIITGNASNNIIYGNAGNDTLNGAAGDDGLNGGAGIDTINCGAGSDIAVDGETVNADCEISI
jgi:Ca2+-binding RTX toxin-like protein